jgi:sialidase-1
MSITRPFITAVALLALWAQAGPAVPAGHPLASALARPQPASVDRDVSQVDVFTAGEGGYHTYRIPSVILTPRGSLIAFAEGRRGGAGDAGDIDLVSRRSEDGGRTWSPVVVLGDNGPNTFGNPCPVVDRKSRA